MTAPKSNHASDRETGKPGPIRAVDALHYVNTFMGSITNLDELLNEIMAVSKEVVGAEASSLMLYDDDNDELYFEVALGASGNQAVLKQEVRLKPGEGIAGSTLLTRKSVNVSDAQNDPRFYKTADQKSGFVTRSILAVPLIGRDKPVGVIEVLNKQDETAFTETDEKVLEIIARQATTAIENAWLIEQNIRAERLAAIGEAITGISHYVKNILASIIGSIDLIDTGIETADIEILRRSWPIFRRNSARIANLVEDMLTFSGSGKPVRRPCSLQTLIQEVVRAQESIATPRNVRLETSVPEDAPSVLVDERLLHRCLLNLVSNAFDAVSDGTGLIQVDVELDRERSELKICVRDNGVGIAKEIRTRVYEPFFTTKGSRGTGLGLSVSKRIVEAQDGKLTFESEIEKGSVFVLVLPVEVVSEESITSAGQGAPGGQQRETGVA